MSLVYRTHGDGRWFPGDGRELREMTVSLLAAADTGPVGDMPVVAGIAPHAGYAYSGAVAAFTFRALQEAARRGAGPETVVVLGFPHRASFRGLAWLDAAAIRTPMGEMQADRTLMERVAAEVPGVFFDTGPHAAEHSAENQLPFLQAALPGVPVATGLLGGHDEAFRMALVRSLVVAAATRRVCVIASTDLLHDPDYDRVVASDESTLRMMERLDSDGLNKAWSYERQVCCGIGPVLAALETARMLGCRHGRRLLYRNSGDIDPSGRGQWVVGYGSMVFTREGSP
jgi:AmmeMemoRadiSam system protein B